MVGRRKLINELEAAFNAPLIEQDEHDPTQRGPTEYDGRHTKGTHLPYLDVRFEEDSQLTTDGSAISKHHKRHSSSRQGMLCL